MVTPRVIAGRGFLRPGQHRVLAPTMQLSRGVQAQSKVFHHRRKTDCNARLRRATASGKLYNQTTPQEVSDDRVVKWLARQGSNLRTSG